MNVKFLLVCFSALMLTACGKSDTDLDDVQPAIAPKASSTAIFLPGGGGIDFFIQPVYDNIAYNNEFKSNERTVNLIIDAPPDKVVKDINGVFLEQNYIVSERKDYSSIAHYLYVKGNDKFTVSFKVHCSEGFNCKKTEVFFWYLIAEKN